MSCPQKQWLCWSWKYFLWSQHDEHLNHPIKRGLFTVTMFIALERLRNGFSILVEELFVSERRTKCVWMALNDSQDSCHFYPGRSIVRQTNGWVEWRAEQESGCNPSFLLRPLSRSWPWSFQMSLPDYSIVWKGHPFSGTQTKLLKCRTGTVVLERKQIYTVYWCKPYCIYIGIQHHAKALDGFNEWTADIRCVSNWRESWRDYE